MDTASNRCMLKSIVILWILILTRGPPSSDGFRIVCYFSNSAQYRSEETAFHASHVDPFMCTHIVYSNAKNRIIHLTPSEGNDTTVYNELLALKNSNPNLQILLSVGHVMGLPEYFFEAAENDMSRIKFAKNVVGYIRFKGLDGINLEWFNLAYKKRSFFIKENFQELLRMMRIAFDEEARKSNRKLTLAVTTSANRMLIDNGVNVAEMANLADFLSIRTMDPSTLDDRILDPTEMYSNKTERVMSTAASYYQSFGVPPEKINIGISTYGRSYTIDPRVEHLFGIKVAGKGHAGKYTGISGIMSYFEMCELIREGGSVRRLHRGPYYVKDTQWISFEDIGSVMQKACFIKEKNYGGITLWTLDLDDFTGLWCRQGKFPLVATAAYVLRSTEKTLCASKVWDTSEVASIYTTRFPVRRSSDNDLGSNRLVCYMTNWARFRPEPGKFFPENINPNLCTHIIYAYAVVNNMRIVPRFPEEESLPWQPGLYSRIMQTKTYHPQLKVLLSVGGDGAGTSEFERVTKNADTMSIFSKNAIRFLRDRDFDGLEIFWAYPTPQTSVKLKELLQSLHDAFDGDAEASKRTKLILTTAMSASIKRIFHDYGADLVYMAKPTDFISLMTFDFHGKWDIKTGFNSPLYAAEHDVGEEATLNVDYVAHIYTMLGVPKHKINIGIPTYGVSFKLRNPHDNALGSPVSGAGSAGKYTSLNGILAYYEVCSFIGSGAKKYYVSSQKAPYAVKEYVWVGFEDATSVTAKACYALSSGFGGVSIWTLDLDDFIDTCKYGKFPLLNAVHSALRRDSVMCKNFSFLKTLRSTSGADRPIQSNTLQHLMVPLLWLTNTFYM